MTYFLSESSQWPFEMGRNYYSILLTWELRLRTCRSHLQGHIDVHNKTWPDNYSSDFMCFED